MARPVKNNAEYFSHDADMRNDVKIKALRRRFSHKGYAVWCFILETLTDTDGFALDFDEVSQELLAADFEVGVDELRAIVEYCQKIGLLQMTPEDRLFSEAHQRRFSGLMTKRERDRKRLERFNNARNSANSEVIAAKTLDKVVSVDENTHSKEKKSKGEESKEKKIYPYQGIADLWNEVCVSLPRVQKMNDKRRQKIRLRLEEWGVKPDEALTAARDIFTRVQASDFLTGRNKHQWTASFDWLFENTQNSVKVMEGNYDNKGCGFNRGAQTGVQAQGGQLGVGEFIDGTGRRTYGSGRATIPQTAPPRPSERHSWDCQTQTWVLL